MSLSCIALWVTDNVVTISLIYQQVKKTTPLADELLAIRSIFLSRLVYRVLLTGIHLMRAGEIEATLVRLNETFRLPYVPELIERKVRGTEKGTLDQADLAFHEQEFERLRAELENVPNLRRRLTTAGCRNNRAARQR